MTTMTSSLWHPPLRLLALTLFSIVALWSGPAHTEEPAPAPDVQEPEAGEEARPGEGDLRQKIRELEGELERARALCSSSGPAEPLDRDALASRIRQMRPAAAARVMAGLEIPLAVDLLGRIDGRRSARILEKIPSARATEIVTAMALPDQREVSP